jgi:MFS family permease
MWSGSSFFLNIPLGVLADKYSRKNLLMVGQVTKIIAYLFWIVMPNYWGFLLGFMFWGAKAALYSGTNESLIYDELALVGKEGEYTKVWGRLNAFAQVGAIIASAAASVIAPFGYATVLWVCIFFVSVSLLPMLSLPTAPRRESTHTKEFFHLLKEGFRASYDNKLLFRLILFFSIAIAIEAAVFDYYNPFMREAGISTNNLGLFFAITVAVDGVSSYFGHKLKHWENKYFYLLFAACGVLLFTAAASKGYLVFGLILMFIGFYRLITVVFDGKLQDEIPSHIRATVTSVKSFGYELSALTMYFVFGLVTTGKSFRIGFEYLGLYIMLLGVLYWVQKIGVHAYKKVTT